MERQRWTNASNDVLGACLVVGFSFGILGVRESGTSLEFIFFTLSVQQKEARKM